MRSPRAGTAIPDLTGTRVPSTNRLRAWLVRIDATTRVVPTAVWVLLLTVAPVTLGLVAGPVDALFIVGYAVLLVAAGLALWHLRSRPVALTVGLTIWLSSERFLLAVLADRLTPFTITALLTYDELFFPAIILFSLPALAAVWRTAPRWARVVDVLAILFGVLVVLAILVPGAPIAQRVVYARRLAVLPMVYVAARVLPFRIGDLRRVVSVLLVAAAGLAVFGLLERFALSGFIWGTLAHPVQYYAIASFSGGAGVMASFNGLPHTFWTFEGGVQTRRLVSTFLEATTIAAFFGLGTVLATASWLQRPRSLGRLGVIALIAIATFLTLGKAGMVIGVVGGGYAIGTVVLPPLRRPAWFAVLAGGVIATLILLSLLVEWTGVTSGIGAHFTGLGDGINSLLAHPLGLGLGTTGAFAQSQQVAESTIGVLMAQLGWPGLLLWAPWMVGLGVACAVAAQRLGRDAVFAFAAGAAIIAFFATTTLTESAGGLLGNWAFAYLGGVVVTAALAAGRVGPTDVDIAD